MKKLIHLTPVLIFVMLAGCHTKKKFAETHKLEEKTSHQVADSSSSKINVVATRSDSTKTVKSDSTHSKKTEKIDIEFNFGPVNGSKPVVFTDTAGGKSDPVLSQLIKSALMHADNLRIHIEREQDERSGSTSTEQKAVKENQVTQAKASQVHQESTDQHKKQADTKTTVETKPDYVWIIWLVGVISLLFVLLFLAHKLNWL